MTVPLAIIEAHREAGESVPSRYCESRRGIDATTQQDDGFSHGSPMGRGNGIQGGQFTHYVLTFKGTRQYIDY